MKLLIEERDGPEPRRIFDGLHERRGSFFLESALPSRELSLYSILGFDPFLSFEAVGSQLTVKERGGALTFEGDVVAELRKRLAAHRCEPHPELPFVGGAVGYFAYEIGARWEIRTKAGPSAEAPDVELGFYDGVLLYSHQKRRWFLVANALHDTAAPAILERLRAAFDEACDRPPFQPGSGASTTPYPRESREQYVKAVGRIKDYIRAGDVYQVNLSHAFEAPWRQPPYTLYHRLRELSPAPFASYLSTAYGQVIGCSPERFLRVRSGIVETRPIKGTRPRGATPRDDERLAGELIGSAKERAELLMIVDLERNDLGRVCVPGSIRVTDLYRLEAHPTVFHLVATVTGKLRPDADLLDLLRAAFPGGSITGAPKIRAMQIIDELESTPRHVYTGCIGYLGFDGGCDLAIAIRTMVVRGGRASYHVGAGIVWDSDPECEYEETLAKGRALFAALSGAPERNP